MGKLTRDDILKLARLSRLDINEAEIEEFAAELSDILQYVEMLQAVNVDGFLPTNQVTGLTNVFRDDVIEPYEYDPAELLKNVPETMSEQIKVKRMIT